MSVKESYVRNKLQKINKTHTSYKPFNNNNTKLKTIFLINRKLSDT
jgi:hypothetical protein